MIEPSCHHLFWAVLICTTFFHTKAQTTLPLDDEVYQLVVVFNSQCCGIDREAAIKLHQLLDSIKAPHYTEYWGKEGEKNVYVDLSPFSHIQSKYYWFAIGAICQASADQLVRPEKRLFFESSSQQLVVHFGQSEFEKKVIEEVSQIILQKEKWFGSPSPIVWCELSEEQSLIFKKGMGVEMKSLNQTQQLALLKEVIQVLHLSK
jgi:hypothetical protein